MGTLCRPLPAVLRGAVGTVLLVLAACSSDGGNPGTRVLSGLVNVARFEVAPGERVQCTGDVTVQCQTAAIAGELYSSDGRQAVGDAPDITIQATGDVVLTGRVVTGHGAGGAEQGGDGGDIRLASSGGSLTIGSPPAARGRAVQPVLQSGDGGNGADGLLGGAGGDGGVIRLEAPDGVLTIHQRPGLIQVGNGGQGGRGVVGGQDLLTFTPPAKQPNGGGDSGGIIAAWNTVVGAEVVANAAATPSQRLLLGAGAITGGRGGDAGDCYVGVDPGTGGSTWPARSGSRAGREDKYVEVVGSGGGEGATQGGQGSSVDVSYADEPVSTGVRGTSVEARGGEGGEADWRNGVGSDGQDLHGGQGGAAKAVGGTGGPGDGCGAQGTAGGKATARAGDGGDSNEWVVAHEHWFPGDGGDAESHGGKGGAGGSCCSPPGQAGDGGTGGDSDAKGGNGGSAFPNNATQQGEGGDAAAFGGDGGDGGDGAPPGLRGNAGNPFAEEGFSERKRGKATIDLGHAGELGKLCPGAPPPIVDEVEPNDAAETATPMDEFDEGRGSVDKVDGDPCDFFEKTLPAGGYEIQVTPIDGHIGLIGVFQGTQLLGVGTDPNQPVPFDLPSGGNVTIELGAPRDNRNGYAFAVVTM